MQKCSMVSQLQDDHCANTSREGSFVIVADDCTDRKCWWPRGTVDLPMRELMSRDRGAEFSRGG